MKRRHNPGEPLCPSPDSPHADTSGLLKAGICSLLLHVVLILFLMLNLKPGITKGSSFVYGVILRPYSAPGDGIPRGVSGRGLSAPPAVLSSSTLVEKMIMENTKIQKEEDKSTQEIKQREPVSDHKDLDQEILATQTVVGIEGFAGGDSGKESGIGGGGVGWGGPGNGGTNILHPRYAGNQKPVYPLEARRKGYEGKVLLGVEVLPNGEVGRIEIKKSSGYEVLDQSALSAVKKWKFIPAKKGEVSIPYWVNVPIKFRLLL